MQEPAKLQSASSGTPGGSPVLGGHGQYGGMASAEPSPRGGDDATNNPSNDLFQANEDVFVEALNTTKTNNVLLKDYFLSDERAGDIVYFPQDRLPWFDRGRSISDKQERCICSLRPMLMLPGASGGWKFEEAAGPTCGAVRNTTAAKKELENYKYTGFCKDHVQGEGLGSREHYEKTGGKSVRGFNLERNVNDRRMRHLLCLETQQGLVFLKWCTQCHLWKNFAGFTERQGKGGQDLAVHTFCQVCHQRQVLSRDKRRMERAKKRKAAEMEGSKAKVATKDKDLEDVAEKISLMRQNTMDRAWIKSFALESTLSKFNKFSKTIFENIDGKPIVCGVFAGTAEDIIVIRAMDILIELQVNPQKTAQGLGGEGRWVQVVHEIMENDLEPALAGLDGGGGGSGGGGSLQRQTSLELWGKPNRTEIVRRRIQELMQVDEVRYKIILLGSLLVEARLQALLEREVRLEAMYEGCILMAFTCDLKPEEKEGKYLQLNPEQMYGLHKMGWCGLHYKCGEGQVMSLVEGPKPHQDPLVEIVEMVGVKQPPPQLLEKKPESLATLYPRGVLQVVGRDAQGLMETCSKEAESGEPGAEQVDWQGCTAMHHAIVHAGQGQEDRVLGALLYHKADCVRPNRRGFTPLEVAALASPVILPILVNHYLNSPASAAQDADKSGGSARSVPLSPQQDKAEKAKVLRKLQKTLESSVKHVNHDLVKHNAQQSIKIIADMVKLVE